MLPAKTSQSPPANLGGVCFYAPTAVSAKTRTSPAPRPRARGSGRVERQKPGRLARPACQPDSGSPGSRPREQPAGATEIDNPSDSGLRGRFAAGDRSRQVPPLELEPFSDQWLAWYAERRLRSEIDLLNHNYAPCGIVLPLE
jgi:hypothetical protein